MQLDLRLVALKLKSACIWYISSYEAVDSQFVAELEITFVNSFFIFSQLFFVRDKGQKWRL
jgi:hypothetical protein